MTVKITSFEAENVKRIKAVQLQPTENGLTVIGGRNNQGKTSVLDAIAWTHRLCERRSRWCGMGIRFLRRDAHVLGISDSSHSLHDVALMRD